MQTTVFRLTEQHLAVIGEALGNLPYRVAQPVIDELRAQWAAQHVKQPSTENVASGDRGDAP